MGLQRFRRLHPATVTQKMDTSQDMENWAESLGSLGATVGASINAYYYVRSTQNGNNGRPPWRLARAWAIARRWVANHSLQQPLIFFPPQLVVRLFCDLILAPHPLAPSSSEQPMPLPVSVGSIFEVANTLYGALDCRFLPPNLLITSGLPEMGPG